MKLNPDCIRDVLLAVERDTDTVHSFEYSPKSQDELLDKYDPEEVFYHIRQCEMHGYVIIERITLDRKYVVKDLTPQGHEFLANIRSDTIWDKTKDRAKSVGSFSLDVLSKIASNILTEIIKGNV